MSLIRASLAPVRDRAIAALDDRPVMRDGPANLMRGWEGVGGWLAVSPAGLSFAPHFFNFQTAPLVVPAADILGAWPCWTRMFGLLPVAPNSVAVAVAGGRVYRFVVWDRKGWAASLMHLAPASTLNTEPDADDGSIC